MTDPWELLDLPKFIRKIHLNVAKHTCVQCPRCPGWFNSMTTPKICGVAVPSLHLTLKDISDIE